MKDQISIIEKSVDSLCMLESTTCNSRENNLRNELLAILRKDIKILTEKLSDLDEIDHVVEDDAVAIDNTPFITNFSLTH